MVKVSVVENFVDTTRKKNLNNCENNNGVNERNIMNRTGTSFPWKSGCK
jgi:hypothetical protein